MTDGGDLVGKVIYGYELVKLLATGGTSEIYEGRPKGVAERKVAVKVAKRIHPKYNKDLETLADTLGKINHPNVVDILNAGEIDGRKFLILEYMKNSFENVLPIWKGQVTDVTTLSKITIDVLKGLEAAHEEGIIHQDITPKNVLINEKGTAKLADFFDPEVYAGEEESDNLSSVRTVKEQSKDDVVDDRRNYLSPEQKKAIDTDIGPQSDVYAWGACVYEALMGHVPMGGSQKITEKHPAISKWFEKGIEKAIAVVPARRWGNAKTMREHFEQGLEGKLNGSKPKYAQRGLISEIWFLYDDLIKLGAASLIAMLGVLALGWIYTNNKHYHLEKRSELRTKLDLTKGTIAYIANRNTIGIYNPSSKDIDGATAQKFKTDAEDIVGLSWSPDGERLLLIDEPYSVLLGDANNTVLRVFYTKAESDIKVLELDNTDRNIKEAYWSRSDENKIYVNISDKWHDLNMGGDAPVLKPVVDSSDSSINLLKKAKEDMHRTHQYGSKNGKLKIISKEHAWTNGRYVAFELIGENWTRRTELEHIPQHEGLPRMAWFYPKESEQNVSESDLTKTK